MFQSFTIVISLAALFSFINHKWLKLPTTIGLMLLALTSSLLLIAAQPVLPHTYDFFDKIVLNIDFKSILLDVMLSFLLFAGALHINLHKLEAERWPVLIFASIGVLISTVVVGILTYFAAGLIGMELPFIHAMLFGALISPTDPIAVLAILKSIGVEESLELKIEGESLFNDGVGVVVFMSVMLLTGMGHESPDISGFEIARLFAEEAVGGLLFGLALGYLGYRLLYLVEDDGKICMQITLAVAMGGYALAGLIHVSGPLAMVVAGLLIGNKIEKPAFDANSRKLLYSAWEVLDDILNAVLFVLIGLVVHTLTFQWDFLLLGVLSIFIVLIARFLSVGIPFSLLNLNHRVPIKTISLLSWGGLRGGISVALALSLADVLSHDLIVFITYTVVIFSILVQGLSIGKPAKWLKMH